jgi:G3E family GTPase
VEVFWLDDELSSSIYLDGVVAVVDCMHFPEITRSDHFLEHSEIGRKQVAIADRVLINKTDLVSPDTLTDITSLIRSFNPEAKIFATCQSVVDPSWVLNIGAYSSKPTPPIHDHNHVLSTVDHVYLKFPSSIKFEKAKMETVLGNLIWESSDSIGNIYRAKALFAGPSSWFSVQSVGALFEVVEQPTVAAETEYSRFLFIGTKLNESTIREKILSSALD